MCHLGKKFKSKPHAM